MIFWDLYGEKGHRVRTTISEMGPLLLSRLMNATDAQEGVINIAFKIADEGGLPLLDLKDFQALLNYMAENASALSGKYGYDLQGLGRLDPARTADRSNSRGRASSSASRRSTVSDIMRTDADGRGVVSILAADQLMQSPRLYATFLLWLLSELFEVLPEVGDPDKPKLVFFFDEAHLLFDDAPKALIDKVEQVVKLIRSKGVGVYFVTQNPVDIPESVLAQLANRIQHALRAYTPREQKAVRVAAETFRPNPDFSTEPTVITNLGTGEALVSTLEGKGAPSMVERTLIRPPSTAPRSADRGRAQEHHGRQPRRGPAMTRISTANPPTRSSPPSAPSKRNATQEQEPQEQPRRHPAAPGGSRWTLPGFGDDDARRTSHRPSSRSPAPVTSARPSRKPR